MYGFNFLGINTKLPQTTTKTDVDDLLKGAPKDMDTFKEVSAAINEIKAKLGESGNVTSAEVDQKIADAIAVLTENSDVNFDTFKEISDWLTNTENKTAADIITAINNHASEINSLKTSKLDVITDLETISSNAALGATALQSYEETDPIWASEKNNYYTKEETNNTFLTEHQDISGKQDIISDLDTIRNGSALGATSVQSETLKGYLPIMPGDDHTNGNAYNLPYYFYTAPEAEKIVVHSLSVTLDGNKTYGDYTLDVLPATTKIAGIMSAADKSKLDSALLASNISRLVMKDMVENTCTKYIEVNAGYQVFVCGQNIEFKILDLDSKLMTATGLVSWIRHIISNGNAVGTDINTVTMTCGEISTKFDTSDQADTNPSTVASGLLTFFATITSTAIADIKLGQLVGKDITFNVTDGITSIDYRIFVNS